MFGRKTGRRSPADVGREDATVQTGALRLVPKSAQSMRQLATGCCVVLLQPDSKGAFLIAATYGLPDPLTGSAEKGSGSHGSGEPEVAMDLSPRSLFSGVSSVPIPFVSGHSGADKWTVKLTRVDASATECVPGKPLPRDCAVVDFAVGTFTPDEKESNPIGLNGKTVVHTVTIEHGRFRQRAGTIELVVSFGSAVDGKSEPTPAELSPEGDHGTDDMNAYEGEFGPGPVGRPESTVAVKDAPTALPQMQMRATIAGQSAPGAPGFVVIPELVKEGQYHWTRFLYAVEPITEIRRAIEDIAEWKSRATSCVALAVWVYVWYAGLWFPMIALSLALAAVFAGIRRLRTPVDTLVYIPSSSVPSMSALRLRVYGREGGLRAAASAALANDVRMAVGLLKGLANAADRIREIENDSVLIRQIAVSLFVVLGLCTLTDVWSYLIALFRFVTMCFGVYIIVRGPVSRIFPSLSADLVIERVRSLLSRLDSLSRSLLDSISNRFRSIGNRMFGAFVTSKVTLEQVAHKGDNRLADPTRTPPSMISSLLNDFRKRLPDFLRPADSSDSIPPPSSATTTATSSEEIPSTPSGSVATTTPLRGTVRGVDSPSRGSAIGSPAGGPSSLSPPPPPGRPLGSRSLGGSQVQAKKRGGVEVMVDSSLADDGIASRNDASGPSASSEDVSVSMSRGEGGSGSPENVGLALEQLKGIVERSWQDAVMWESAHPSESDGTGEGVNRGPASASDFAKLIVQAADSEIGVLVQRRKQGRFGRRVTGFVARELVDWVVFHVGLAGRREFGLRLVRAICETGAISFSSARKKLDDDAAVFAFDYARVQNLALAFSLDVETAVAERKSSVLLATTDAEAHEELTERDWKLLLTGAVVRKFHRGDTILTQGSPNGQLFRIVTGSVHVSRSRGLASDAPVAFQCDLGVGDFFGENGVVDPTELSHVRVVATSPVLEVAAVRSPLLRSLLDMNPSLCRRFFFTIASRLATILAPAAPSVPSPTPSSSMLEESHEDVSADRKTAVSPVHARLRPLGRASLSPLDITSMAVSAPAPASPRESSASLTNSLDDVDSDSAFNKIFGLEGEVVVTRYAGVSRAYRLLSVHGTLFVSQRYVCFLSKVFGRRVSEVIPLESVTGVESSLSSKSRLKVQSADSQCKFSFESPALCEEARSLISRLRGLLREAAKHTPSPALAPRKQAIGTGAEGKDKEKEAKSGGKEGPGLSTHFMESLRRAEEGAAVARIGFVEAEVLSADDWDLVLSRAQYRQLAKNEAVFLEGDHHMHLFYVAMGRCRVEVGGIVRGSMDTGAVFGEISFLKHSPASASVFAETNVVLYMVSKTYLNLLFAQNPSLAGRFYMYLCWLLQMRIRRIDAQWAANENAVEPAASSTSPTPLGSDANSESPSPLSTRVVSVRRVKNSGGEPSGKGLDAIADAGSSEEDDEEDEDSMEAEAPEESRPSAPRNAGVSKRSASHRVSTLALQRDLAMLASSTGPTKLENVVSPRSQEPSLTVPESGGTRRRHRRPHREEDASKESEDNSHHSRGRSRSRSPAPSRHGSDRHGTDRPASSSKPFATSR